MSLRADRVAGTGDVRDGLSRDWYPWFARNGLEPFLLPNRAEAVAGHFERIDPRLLVLTGGNDVVDAARGGDSWDDARSRTEEGAIACALARGVPIFGVCRGFQLLNRYFGGDVVASETDPALVGHIAVRHRVSFSGDRSRALGASGMMTNSFHRFCVRPQQLAPSLDVVATCEDDGSVEAFAHREHKVLAMQWHPERDGSDPGLDDALLATLLSPP